MNNCFSFLYFFIILIFFVGCKNIVPENIQDIGKTPTINPDYINVTIPFNIAPLNFSVQEEGSFFWVKISSDFPPLNQTIQSSDGIIRIPATYWKKLLQTNRGGRIQIQILAKSTDKKRVMKFKPFSINISEEKIDPYIVYRLIHPGYYNWSDIKIIERSLENFKEKTLIDNQLIAKNCVNCHSFNNCNSDRFLIHVRGSRGGTYFIENNHISNVNLKSNSIAGATYPAWHPDGRFIAFSANEVRQNFYARPPKSIEVYDLYSYLIVYDKKENNITYLTGNDSIVPLQTFPTWSPDGSYLYYCNASFKTKSINKTLDINEIMNIRYNLERRSFNPATGSFGKAELIFEASTIGKSVSFPRISPDGKYMVLTLTDFGTFPVWHEEADLYLFNLRNGEYKRLNLNSNRAESYHGWSSNGKWLVFSSKRMDGRSSVPYFAYIGSWNDIGKPFVLPQSDPTFYKRLLKSFNLPEFIKEEITITPRNFERASRNKAKAVNSPEFLPKWFTLENKEHAEIAEKIHE